MKKSLLYLLCFVTCPVFLIAQAPDTVWTHTYGGTGNDIGYAVVQTADGGFIVVGSTTSFGAGGKDGYVVRTNANGDTMWTKCFGGQEDDEFYDIKPTWNGRYIIAGYTRSFEGGGPCLYTDPEPAVLNNHAHAEIWLLEIDSLGDTLRTLILGGSGDDIACAVACTNDSNFVVTGSVPVGFFHNIFLLKTDLNYGCEWLHIYQYEMAWGTVVEQTNDGGYIIAGDGSYPDCGASDIFIKTDGVGVPVWETFFSGSFYGTAQIVESSDGYMVSGYGLVHDSIGIYLSKLNSSGDTIWCKIIYALDSFPWDCRCQSLQRTDDGGFIIAGSYGLHTYMLILKTDANSDTAWSRIIETANLGYSVQQTTDNGYVVAGYTDHTGAGASDIYMVKLAPETGTNEQPAAKPAVKGNYLGATIFTSTLQLPKDKSCRVFDIMGRAVEPAIIRPGVYFIEVDGMVTQKVVKIR